MISLLVHEQPDVVLDQCLNFSNFFPESHIVIHVNKSACFTPEDLTATIKSKSLKNATVNPQQSKLEWGHSIIHGHIINVAMIKSEFNASFVGFHSSNDMLVKPVKLNYLTKVNAAYHVRNTALNLEWWPGKEASYDTELQRLLVSLGASQIIGSQIEGAYFSAKEAFEIFSIINNFNFAKASTRYTFEEILPFTIANAIGIKAGQTPYIYSEVHRFDAHVWKARRTICKLLAFLERRGNDLPIRLWKVYHDAYFKYGRYGVSIEDVDAVIKASWAGMPEQWRCDGREPWKQCGKDPLFGVKRVKRDVNDPVRTYIRQL